MIDDTLKKRGQLHLIYNRPLRLVEKVKRSVSGSTKAVKRDHSKGLQTQPSSSHPKTASDQHFREGVRRDNSKGLPAQPSSSRPKTSSDPHPLIREGVRSSSIPSSSTSAKGRPAVTPAPRKRSSDTPNSAMKRQKTEKYPGCPICGGPHHLVKDCPIVTVEGPKRYFLLFSDFMTSLLTTSWLVYVLQSSDWSLD